MSLTPPARKRPRLSPRARTTLPRLAVNATLAGLWASSLLALLVFFLNPDISLRLRSFPPVAGPMMLFYAPLSGLVWAVLAGGVRLFATFRVRVPWVGFRPFWRFLVADLCLLAAVYALNLSRNQDYLPSDMNTHLLGATLFLSLAAALFAMDALWRGLSRQRLRPWPRLVAALLLTGALLGIRERYREVVPPRSASEIEPSRPAADLVFIGLQGAAPDDLLPLLAAGQLPFLKRLFQQGSSAPLKGFRPPHLPAAWATILTGALPPAHGIIETVVHDPPGPGRSLRIAPSGIGFAGMERLGLVAAVKRRDLVPPIPTLDRILRRCGYRVVASG
ncbi:MAG: alkaline phosphatase family protein, partial [Acidobacteriota bacterium]